MSMEWIKQQVVGTAVNIKQIFTQVTPESIIPPSLWGLLTWFLSQFPLATGLAGTPQQQVYASIVLAFATFLSGFATGGLAWALIGVWLVTGVIGLLRMIPALNSGVESVRTPFRSYWYKFVDLIVNW